MSLAAFGFSPCRELVTFIHSLTSISGISYGWALPIAANMEMKKARPCLQRDLKNRGDRH